MKAAVKLKPDDTEYQTELGAILVKLAEYREAISSLRKAVELDPENSRAIDLLEDAEAGRKRIDFVSDKSNGNRASNSARANSNANAASPPRGRDQQRKAPGDENPYSRQARTDNPAKLAFPKLSHFYTPQS